MLLGPSGCGKTTTLRLIAGFLAPDAGDIRVDGRSIVALPPHKRDMGIVFQSYALFPHLTVARNIAFGLEMRRDRERRRSRRGCRKCCGWCGWRTSRTDCPDSCPAASSNAWRWRRALAIHPRVLLLDEPLSNLDAALRQDMAREIRLLQQARGITTIMVTHDQTEAMALADRLVLMHDGKVQQIGPPEALHLRPANPFVARFIGGSNIVRGRIDAATHTAAARWRTDQSLPPRYPGTGAATSRGPPRQHPARRARPTLSARAEGTVELCAWLGATVEHVVRLSPETTLLARGPGLGPDAAPRHKAGAPVTLHWSAEDEFLFDASDRPIAAATTDFTRSRETNDA